MSNGPNNYIELRQQRDFSAVISTGFQFIRQNWKTLYRPLVFICLPVYLVASVLFGNFFRTMFTSARGGNIEGMMASMGSMMIGYLLLLISMLLLYTMVYEYMRFYMVNKGMAPAMGEYFSERSYGERVKEIFYREFCLKEGYKDKLLYYGSRRKIVDCAIVLDYEAVLKMGIEEYGKYLAKLYIERSNQFTELKVKDFDVGKYVEDLESFFKLNKLL